MPTLIVPDEQTWTMLGFDPQRLGAEPSFRVATTTAVLAPVCVPEQLKGSLLAYVEMLPASARVEPVNLPLPTTVPAPPELPDHDEAHDPGMGHGHDHGDMMAIVGEPSADGLIMEPLKIRFGPIGVPLPGGLTIEATLDGDVVEEASVFGLRAAEVADFPDSPAPDPLSPAASTAAISGTIGRARIAELELERAISHLAWLRSLSRLLGWSRLTDLTARAITELAEIDPTGTDRGGFDAPAATTATIRALVGGSRGLGWRLRGRGVVTADRAESLGLTGPNARATGLARDGRLGDPAYMALGFEPTVEAGGDALARTLLRAREARGSIELARAASAADTEEGSTGSGERSGVEGPRGPLLAERADGGWRLRAPGAEAARTLAAELMIGERWEDALVVLASFDISPWEAGP